MHVSKQLIRYYSFILLLCISSWGIAQKEYNFKDFQAIRAEGNIPTVLTSSIEDAVKANISAEIIPTEEKQIEFARFATIAFSGIIKTGDVLFGDPMTQYVQKIGNRLLEFAPDTKGKIQFFVYKNNITNALTMEPGVIFVTTGLLSQIENEAQLAFILSHEISHFRAKHIQHSFMNKTADASEDDLSYLKLTQLSRENETDADTKGIELYQKAGYAKSEIDKTFLVLMYSYLPFDEIPVDSTLFGDFYVPKSYFPSTPNPIIAFENYDDKLSTHPNIKTRKTAIGKVADKMTNWKDNLHFETQEEFVNVRDMARFVTVRQNLLMRNFVDVMYETYILEKKYPKNEYLTEMKGIAWTELNQIYAAGGKRSFMKNTNNIEGAQSILYSFLNKLDKQQLALLTMRLTEDFHQAFPENKSLVLLRDQSIKLLTNISSLDIKTLERISFYDALKLNAEENQSSSEATAGGNSKYDRISQIQQQNSSSKSVRPLTDDNFAFYLIPDLVEDEGFMQRYEGYVKGKLDKKPKISMTEDEIADVNLVVDISTFALKNNEIDPVAINNMIAYWNLEIVKSTQRYNLVDLRYQLATDFSLEAYNNLSVLNDYYIFTRNMSSENYETFYPDQSEVSAILGKYDHPNLLFIYSVYNYNKSRKIKRMSSVLTTLFKNKTDKYSYVYSSKLGKGAITTTSLYLFKNL